MNNYVPTDLFDREALVQSNPLFEEILERRKQYGCDTCDFRNNAAADDEHCCQSCFHNYDDETIGSVELTTPKHLLELKRIAKAKTVHGRTILSRCSCAKNFTGQVSMYFAIDGKLRIAEIKATYCPICGRKFDDNNKE